MWHEGIHPRSNHLTLSNVPDPLRGDIIDCVIDFFLKTIEFRAEGMENPYTVRNCDFGTDGVVPAFTLARGQSITVNFGAKPFLPELADDNTGGIDQTEWTAQQIADRELQFDQRFAEEAGGDPQEEFNNILMNARFGANVAGDREEEEEEEEEEEPEDDFHDIEVDGAEEEEDEEDDDGDQDANGYLVRGLRGLMMNPAGRRRI